MCSPIKPGEVLTVQNGKITMKEATRMPPVGTLNENLVDTSRKQNDEGAMIGATLLPAVAVVDTTSRKRHSPDKELLQGTSPDDIIMDNQGNVEASSITTSQQKRAKARDFAKQIHD